VSAYPDSPAASRRWAFATALLLAIAVFRLGAVVLHAPLAGYANQYDMLRTSACIGLWPDGPAAQRALATPQAPRSQYVRDTPDPAGCYPSTDVALAAVGSALAQAADALGIDGEPGHSLRAVGLAKAAAWLAILGFAQFALRRHPRVACAHAGFAALVLADPVNTLYLNTLYTETGALLGAWLAVAGIVLCALPRATLRSAIAALALGGVLLGAARVQHLALPFGYALLAWLAIRARASAPPVSATTRAVATALLVGIALGATALQVATQHRFASIAGANRQNMLFGALLPAADDPARLAARLGLPAACADLAYTTWYRPLGRDIAAECPQAATPRLVRVAVVLASEPRVFAVFAARGLVQSTAWRMPYVGEIAGGSYARLGPGPLGATRSLADAVAGSSLAAHALFWLLPLLAGVGATLRLLRRVAPDDHRALDAGSAACSGIVATVWATALIGDGYSEFARHLHLGVSAALGGWLLLALSLLLRGQRMLVDALTCAALAAGVVALGARLPLAVGRTDTPAADAVARGPLAFDGWVLAPQGAQAVVLTLDGRDAATRPLRAAPDIARLFPAGADTAFRFDGSVTWPDGRPMVQAEWFVVTPEGRRQRFDRRMLRVAAGAGG
jgi:hypothetical protein